MGTPQNETAGIKAALPRSSPQKPLLASTISVSRPSDDQVPKEKIMTNARYYVVGDHDVWMIKIKDGEYGSRASCDEAVVFAIDAAQKLGTRGECAHVCMVDDDGRFQSKWTYDRDHHLHRSAS
jgi:hypothetical protein